MPLEMTPQDSTPSPLAQAQEIGRKARELHFDWEDASQVGHKVEEEWQELKEEIFPVLKSKERAQEELGDLLFSLAQLARHLGLSAEECLHQASEKFLRRFHRMENILGQEGKVLGKLSPSEVDAYWARAKSQT